MRGEVAGNGLDGRHERPIARPRRAKANDDGDDEPTYVDEESNDTLTKAEYEALVKQSEGQDDGTESTQDAGKATEDNGQATLPQAKVEVGQTQKKKRKAVKIGADDADSGNDKDSLPSVPKPKAKSAKKAKKSVTLSFGEDGEDT